MGNGIIICGDTDLLNKVQPLIENKSRDDIISAPFIYGHSLYYVPDFDRIKKISYPEGFEINIKEGESIYELYKFPGFENAISYDINHSRPDILVIYAKKDDKIVAMAGASADCKSMWQIGIDVLSQVRNNGIATILVSNLAMMILSRGIVPYYGTASSNIASQAVAYRSGLKPTWMCSYSNVFDLIRIILILFYKSWHFFKRI